MFLRSMISLVSAFGTARAVLDLGNVLGLQLKILEFGVVDDLALDVLGSASARRWLRSVQRPPEALLHSPGASQESLTGIHAEDELHALRVPPIKVRGQREISIATQGRTTSKPACCLAQSMAASISGDAPSWDGRLAGRLTSEMTSCELARLTTKGPKPPATGVGELHPFLALSSGLDRRPVHIDQGEPTFFLGALTPRLGAGSLHRLNQPAHRGSVKTPKKNRRPWSRQEFAGLQRRPEKPRCGGGDRDRQGTDRPPRD